MTPTVPQKKHSTYVEALALLRFPLAAAVVCEHVFSTQFAGYPQMLSDSLLFREVTDFVMAFVKGQSVPVFFFISGYLFFLGGGFNHGIYKEKLRRRVWTLLLPYLLWNVLILLQYLALLLPPLKAIGSSIADGQPDFSLQGLLYCFWDASHCIFPVEHIGDLNIFPINSPLWFLRDLMIVCCLTPVIHWLIKKGKLGFIILLGAVKFVVSLYDIYYINQLLIALFFFSWGAYFSIFQKNLDESFGKHTKWAIATFLMLGITCMGIKPFTPDVYGILKKINIFVGVWFAYCIVKLFLSIRTVKHDTPHESLLSASSFFIYVAHKLVWIPVFKMLLIVIAPVSGVRTTLVYLLTYLFTMAILLITYWVMRKYVPSLAGILLVGERNKRGPHPPSH